MILLITKDLLASFRKNVRLRRCWVDPSSPSFGVRLPWRRTILRSPYRSHSALQNSTHRVRPEGSPVPGTCSPFVSPLQVLTPSIHYDH